MREQIAQRADEPSATPGTQTMVFREGHAVTPWVIAAALAIPVLLLGMLIGLWVK